MLVGCTERCYFTEARRDEESLLITPCRAMDDMDSTRSPRECCSWTVLQQVASAAVRRLEKSQSCEGQAAFRKMAPPLGALEGMLAHQLMTQAICKPPAELSGVGNKGDYAASDSDSESEEEVERGGVIDRLLARDAAPHPAPRQLEQRLIAPRSRTPSLDAMIFAALSERPPPCTWPAQVHAMREQRFRPSWLHRPICAKPIPVSRPKLSPSPPLANLRWLPKALHDLDDAVPSTASEPLVLEPVLMNPVSSASAGSAIDDAAVEKLLRSAARPDSATGAALDPSAEGDRAFVSRALAPLCSARQRSERSRRMLARAMRPPALGQRERLAFPRCLSLAVDDEEPHEIESALVKPKQIAVTDVAALDPLARFLHPRHIRASSNPSRPHPASGIEPQLLAAHEAALLQRLLESGDLHSQVRPLRVPERCATGGEERVSSMSLPLSQDPIVGTLLTARPIGSCCNGDLALSNSNCSIGDVLGLTRDDLARYRRRLVLDIDALPPPRRLVTKRPLARRLIAGAVHAEAGADDKQPAHLKPHSPSYSVSPQVDVDPPCDAEPGSATQRAIADRGPGGFDSGCCDSPATKPKPAGADVSSGAIRGLRTTSDPACMGPYVMALRESFNDTVDALLQISHGSEVVASEPAQPANRITSPLGALAHRESLLTKLIHHAKASTGLLALLPEGVCEHVPLMAAQLIIRASADGLGVLWLLPEPIIEAARAFWEQFSKSLAGSMDGRPLLAVRPVGATPLSDRDAPPLGAGELAFCALDAFSAEGESCAAGTPAGLVVITANSVEVGQCLVAQRAAQCRLVALICGMPTGGPSSLTALCSTLGARRLFLRTEADPDIRALLSSRLSCPFVLPNELRAIFETLLTDSQAELAELLQIRPELAPIELDSQALKLKIEQLGVARKANASLSDGDQRTFWRLMTLFCSRRILDMMEANDVEAFRGFLAQVVCQKHSKLSHTFAKHATLQVVLKQRDELADALLTCRTSRHKALAAALRHIITRKGFGLDGRRGSPARHVLVTLRHSGSPPDLIRLCEHILSSLSATASVHATAAAPAHARSLLHQTGPLLLLSGPEDLVAASHQAAAEGGSNSSVPLWKQLAHVIEFDPLPEHLRLAAQAHDHLSIITLRPADSPVVDHDRDLDEDVNAPIHAPPSALAELAASLREGHCAAYDDILDVSRLLREQQPPATSEHASVDGVEEHPPANSGDDYRRPVLVGEDLVCRQPRLLNLLRRRGVQLIESGTPLPHLILDHETGVLIFSVEALEDPGATAATVESIATGYRSMWVVVLFDDRAINPSEVWPRVPVLLAELYALPLRVSLRVVRSSECWLPLREVKMSHCGYPASAHADPTAWPYHIECVACACADSGAASGRHIVACREANVAH